MNFNDDVVAVTLGGRYANHMHLNQTDNPHVIAQFFYRWMLFLTANQHTEGTLQTKPVLVCILVESCRVVSK